MLVEGNFTGGLHLEELTTHARVQLCGAADVWGSLVLLITSQLNSRVSHTGLGWDHLLVCLW